MRLKSLKPGFTIFVPLLFAQWSQCGMVTGYIEVKNANTSANLGFVSDTYNFFGEATITALPANRLVVSFAPGGQFAITAVNASNSNLPYLGGIVGFGDTSDSLGSGSYNYVYLGGAALTSPSAVPSAGANSFTAATGIPRHIESSIWALGANNLLTPRWVNANSSVVDPTLEDPAAGGGAIEFTGDPSAFSSIFGATTPLELIFVPATGVPEPACKVGLLLVLAVLVAARVRLRRIV